MRDLYSNDVETAGRLAAHDADGYDDRPSRAEYAELECMEQGEDCGGQVEMRWPGYGDRSWPRCESHGMARLEREDVNTARNFDSTGFDPMDAGETWDVA